MDVIRGRGVPSEAAVFILMEEREILITPIFLI
jgi:hypothetical protein